MFFAVRQLMFMMQLKNRKAPGFNSNIINKYFNETKLAYSRFS